jgi:hypothetical protein
MQRDIVTPWVMTKFTQIPQSSKEVRICFNKDTRRNGIMTSLYEFATGHKPLLTFSRKKGL